MVVWEVQHAEVLSGKTLTKDGRKQSSLLHVEGLQIEQPKNTLMMRRPCPSLSDEPRNQRHSLTGSAIVANPWRERMYRNETICSDKTSWSQDDETLEESWICGAGRSKTSRLDEPRRQFEHRRVGVQNATVPLG